MLFHLNSLPSDTEWNPRPYTVPGIPERGKWVTLSCSHLVREYVPWTVCTSFKLNWFVSRLPGDTVPVLRFFERVELSWGGWYLIFIPDSATQSPLPPSLLLCKLRTWLTGQWCCCTKALVARRCNWRDAEQVEQRAGCYLQVHRHWSLCHPPPFSANGQTPAGCRASSWEKAYMFQNSWGTESFATLLYFTSMLSKPVKASHLQSSTWVLSSVIK